MSTKKQRIQAYVEQALFEAFEAERSTWGVSQSQALERILSERYSAFSASMQPGQPLLEERLEKLEQAFNDFRTESLVTFESFERRLGFFIEVASLTNKLSNELPSESIDGESQP